VAGVLRPRARLPARHERRGRRALGGWHDAGAIVLAAARFRHRFTVLLPVCPDEVPDSPAVLERRAIAERVVAAQKPAHTVAVVRLYWSAFRVGYARLGADSALTDRPPRHHDAVLGRRALGDVVAGGPRTPLAGAPSSLESDPCGCAPPSFRRNDG
jgi:hypothetical protein